MFEGEGETYLDEGNDFLDAASAGSAQYARGGTGNDTMDAGVGNDTLDGDADNDRITGGEGSDLLRGGSGDDMLMGERGAGASGTGPQDDTLYGEGGIDTLYGDADQDVLYGGNGADILYGGDGLDLLRGDNGRDSLDGATGDDSLYGGYANDTLSGGGGHDVLQGDAGSDTFQFLLDPSDGVNVVTITDFAVGFDRMALSATVFAAIGTKVSFGEFVIGTAARDSNDFLLYDPATGNLSYDSDGRGAAAAQLVAHLQADLALASHDFTVI